MGAMAPNTRRLADLAGVGPATLKDLEQLGIRSVAQLARCEAQELWERLCVIKKRRVDPCCQDVFSAAIAHARNPDLEPAKRRWWYWSRVCKERAKPAR
jgi:nucleotidyltransferase/DNA polymerase involved in DNA repair